MKQPILTAENLTIGYVHKKAQKVILSNLNFSLYQGEVVGLLGANGVGKSTVVSHHIRGTPNARRVIIYRK